MQRSGKANTKEAHIGYYLIGDGIQKLYKKLEIKVSSTNKRIKIKTNLYIFGILLFSIVLSLGLGMIIYFGSKMLVFSIVQAVLLFVPISEIVTKVIQNVLSKCVKPKPIPKMDFSEGIPKEYKTMIVIPSILKSAEDVRKVFNKLEVYYLANKSENIYCMALGDCSVETIEKTEKDEDIIKTGLYEINRLNKKYLIEGKEDIFNFAYRKRCWNNCEKAYMGWERKRGILTELNSFLQNRKRKNSFIVNTLENQNLKVKYIITLDSDTELTLNSGIELIEAMAHPLNKPEIENGRVVDGFRNNSA